LFYNYKYNIQITFFSSWLKGIFVTVKKTCVTVKTFWFIITTTHINQMHEVEYNIFSCAQCHFWCQVKVIESVVVFTVTIIIWNCAGKDCYGRDNSAFRYWFRVLQKIFLMMNYVHCYREQRFISTWRLNCCSRWTEELVLCLIKDVE
jgi:hypothetical protein